MTESRMKRSDDTDMFFHHSADLLCIATLDATIVKVNPAWSKVLGFDEQELLDESYSTLIHPDDRREAETTLKSLSRQSRLATLVARYRSKTGLYKLLHCSITSDLGRGQIYLSARELSGNIEKALRHAVETLNSVIVSCPHAVIAVDRERKVWIWNPAATRIFGWTDEEVIGGPVPFVTEEQKTHSKALNERVLRGETLHNFEVRRNRRDGAQVDLLVSAAPIYDANGAIDGFITVATDVTEHKKLEQQFLRTQRLENLGTLASGIAHDLNNVLAPIQMSMELLRMKSADPSVHRILDTLQTCVERGTGLVRQILTFARGVQGERAPIQTHFVMRDIHKVAVETMPKSIAIKSDIPTDLWFVSADLTQLHQVLMNLCVNARDAMPEGGTLSINACNVTLDESFVRMSRCPATGPYVCIQVQDSGSGIPADIREKIFEPFFTTKEVGKGTGLGLSTVAAIVKNHGGFINVYSEENRGTSFKVYLPALSSQSQQNSAQAKVVLPTGNGELILIVDDEAAVRDIATLTLESHGYRIVQAQDGADGVAVYAQHAGEIQLVISDMDMPVMNGAAMIRSLEHINPDVRVLSASGLVADSGKAKPTGPFRKALPKPYTAEQLLNAVHELITAA